MVDSFCCWNPISNPLNTRVCYCIRASLGKHAVVDHVKQSKADSGLRHVLLPYRTDKSAQPIVALLFISHCHEDNKNCVLDVSSYWVIGFSLCLGNRWECYQEIWRKKKKKKKSAERTFVVMISQLWLLATDGSYIVSWTNNVEETFGLSD